MKRFNDEEKSILKNIGFDISIENLTDEECLKVEKEISELYTMYGFDDEEQVTQLGSIYEDILNKLNWILDSKKLHLDFLLFFIFDKMFAKTLTKLLFLSVIYVTII